MTPSEKAHALRSAIPPGGLFQDKTWRIAPDPLALPADQFKRIQELGPRLHAFNKACNLLYRQSVDGKQPPWVHRYLDAGKPTPVVEMGREKRWKNDLPRVIRPDLLLTETGLVLTELDWVPGGIGLTAWLQEAYGRLEKTEIGVPPMRTGFLAALGAESPEHVVIVVSEESRDYRPEMEWISRLSNYELANGELRVAEEHSRLKTPSSKLQVCVPEALEYRTEGVFLGGVRVDEIYRFFELFDLPNIANADKLIAATRAGQVRVTPPFKPQLEEKLWLALFWFPQLADFWRRELGDRYFRDLREVIPFTWLLDPTPLPPHAVIPHLNIQSWEQLGGFSQKQRELILKISGFSERAWGGRGVHVGSDLPSEEWKAVVARALGEFEKHPHILQRFARTRLVEQAWFDFDANQAVAMKGRARLCPYYFVRNDQAELGGVLATICPADKKLIHGMTDAILTLAVGGD